MIELQRDVLFSKSVAEPLTIKLVGIGGAGGNVLDRVKIDGIERLDLIAMNSDAQALAAMVVSEKVQLGKNVTRGLGAGGDPEVGMAAAEEALEEIREAVRGAQIVFVCAGLGGGTGSGAAPVVASVAKEAGALVIPLVTLPFGFEGKRRMRQAEDALQLLQQSADVVVCFENDRMGDAVSPSAGIQQAFASADLTVSQSIRAISMLLQREGIIHVGLDDLLRALQNHNARCLFGYGEAEGDNRAHQALERALKNPLMDRGRLLEEAHHVLVHVAGGANMTLNEVQVLMEELGRHINDETQILFGTAVDARLGNRMSVTVISSLGSPISSSVSSRTSSFSANRHLPKVAQPLRAPEPEKRFEEELAVSESESFAEKTEELPASEVALNEPLKEEMLAEAPAALIAVPARRPLGSRLARPETLTQNSSTPKTPQQATLQFESLTRGRFEKCEPTIVDGEDLDVPTFLRKNMRVK